MLHRPRSRTCWRSLALATPLATSLATLVAVLAAGPPLVADDLRGRDAFLCAVLEVSRCTPGSGCEAVDPATIGVPSFLEIDLAAKQLRTTVASGQNLATPIVSSTRQDGLLFLQGVENGRAWSFVIDEETGDLTAAVARESFSVNAFATCTPIPGARS